MFVVDVLRTSDYFLSLFFFFQAEDGIRYLVRSRGLGDVYKRQAPCASAEEPVMGSESEIACDGWLPPTRLSVTHRPCLLYTSDAADERSSVDLGGRRIIKKKKQA